jgi:hypothetical protein
MAEIKIKKGQWEAISFEEQNRIVEGLKKTGALRATDSIVADENTMPITEDSGIEPMGLFSGPCKILCDAAAATAAAWCTAHTVGLGTVACLAAAETARRECRKRC